MTANVERWRPYVEDALARNGNPFPASFALAIIQAESGGIPSAYRGEASIGDASIGLMQLLLGTAKSLGYSGGAGDATSGTGLYDPATNIGLGVTFLANLYRTLGNLPGVASAYNGGIRANLGFGRPFPGPGTVTVCLARDATGKCISSRTVNPGEYGNAPYVNTVMKAMQSYMANDATGGGGAIPASDGQPDGGSPPPFASASDNTGDTAGWLFELDPGWAIGAAAALGLGLLLWRATHT